MNEIRQRLKALRLELLRRNLDAWYISGTDPHASEYLPDRWQTRAFLSGFTGSYGIVVVTHEEAGLWTDSRYFLQAEEQLKGSGIKMYKHRVPDAIPPEVWLAKKLTPGSKVGFDPQTVTVSGFHNLSRFLDEAGINTVETPDLFEKIWENRPDLPQDKVFELNPSQTGLSRKDKRELVVAELKKYEADFQVITALDELAWLFNLRGSDIPYNPVFTGYGIVGKNEWILFANGAKIPVELKARLEKEKIGLAEYEDFFTWLKSVRGKKVFIDPGSASYSVFSTLQADNKIADGNSVVSLLKARKNSTELEGYRQAMKKDGAALVAFLFWLKENVAKGTETEFTAGRKLAEFRSQQEAFVGESFAPVMGYREHGAIVHLNVGEKDALLLKPEGILLFDSGGQYLHGTTDITRTIALGEVTLQQKTDFTLVLKGMIALSQSKFPLGTKGCNLDVLARMALWEHGLNYGHGTGHGVGHFLNVHEGPTSIRQEFNEVSLQPGMVLSNEPGLYREGEYGIRTENLMVCVEKETTAFGKFFGFETLTLCPIDTRLIDFELLSENERKWLNHYHQWVHKELEPWVSPELKVFLEELTAEV
ncbi:aminopeptidase P family protein [Mariniphaga sediminis]|uniref:Aminopeptidase P family protein n=1 Tax=Mariniphaga sediminis TaxID=1628158 RepID=A0A399D3P7_9BACT|nr:aminopeptidase P family protein [Mariniphaga sediminis]RIH65828.1 aminopeptidase P family protein [Mariniphaga sediminis]